MRRRYLTGAILAMLIAPNPSMADERPEIPNVLGSVAATLNGSLRNGDRDIYPVNATGGQVLSVRIDSPNNEAVVLIFPPGTHYTQDQSQIWTFHGRPVRGADGDAREWSGELTSGGRYLVVVGGGLGQTDYTLDISIQ